MTPPPGEGRCEACESEIAAGDLRCAVCGLTVPEGTAPPPRSRTEVHQLRCDECGAATRYVPEAGGTSCAFCAATAHVEEIRDPLEQTEAWFPFTVDRHTATEALKSWLSSLGWFRPSDLGARSRIQSIRPLFWVGWSFEAQAQVSWAADSEVGSRRSRWAPHSGQCAMTFQDVVISASRGLRSREAAELVPHYQLGSLRDRPDGPDDAILERFDVQRSEARTLVLRGLEATARDRVEREHVPGERCRKLHVATVLRGLDTRRLGFPAWVLAYRYRDASYRVVVCGQDAGVVLGRAPTSWIKVALVSIGVAALLLMLLAAVLANASR